MIERKRERESMCVCVCVCVCVCPRARARVQVCKLCLFVNAYSTVPMHAAFIILSNIAAYTP